MKKKIISVILVAVILTSLAIPAMAVSAETQTEQVGNVCVVAPNEDESTVTDADIITEAADEKATVSETEVSVVAGKGEMSKLAPAILLLLVSAAFVATLVLKRKRTAEKSTGDK